VLDNLKNLRDRLEKVDAMMIHLLSHRFDLSNKIGEIKVSLGKSIEQQEYWSETIQKRKSVANKLNIDQEFIEKLYDIIHAHSIQEQKKGQK